MRLLPPPALPPVRAPGFPQLLEWPALGAPSQSKGVCPGVSVGVFRPVLRTFRVLELYSVIKKSKTLLHSIHTENGYNPTCARQCLCSYAYSCTANMLLSRENLLNIAEVALMQTLYFQRQEDFQASRFIVKKERQYGGQSSWADS